MRRAVVLAAILAGCGVKAPPRPPLDPGHDADAPREQSAAPACPTPSKAP